MIEVRDRHTVEREIEVEALKKEEKIGINWNEKEDRKNITVCAMCPKKTFFHFEKKKTKYNHS